MKVFLAGLETHAGTTVPIDLLKGTYCLASFFGARKNPRFEKIIPLFGDFLLDSGAYTFFGGKTGGVDWEAYIDEYADFVVRNDVKNFFELDIDKFIGYDAVKILRKRLETKARRQCIPVWHKSRGKEEYLKMCDEYPYIAVGGLVGAGGAGASAYSSEVAKYFPWFVSEAHKRGAKIHALGFTSEDGLDKFHFDSVDSTSWLGGNKFGFVYRFDGKFPRHINKKPNQKLANARELYKHNFGEWVKFQKYADLHL